IASDVLSFVDTATITGSYDSATGVLSLTGTDTLANYVLALQSVKYSNTSDDPTVNGTDLSRTISWTVTDANSDGAGAQTSAVQTSTINITAVNDAPVLGGLGGTLAYTENQAATVIDSSITLTDADDTQISSAQVKISAGLIASDVLSFVDTATITGSYDSATGVLSLTGTDTLANYVLALQSVKYSNTSDDPTVNGTD